MKTMRKEITLLLIPAITLAIAISCTYHNEDDYFKDNPDICYTDDMSFKTDIYPLIESSCLSCHSNTNASRGINIEGYGNLKTHAESGIISKVINHESGVSAMPLYADKWSDCSIAKFDAWVEQGMKNN
ncbi:MAG: hypothetical protein K9H26_04510 [Prolixibacteraceae bacterium]|nr:hypothetical protein [Prolixibacteraceae bacterium]